MNIYSNYNSVKNNETFLNSIASLKIELILLSVDNLNTDDLIKKEILKEIFNKLNSLSNETI